MKIAHLFEKTVPVEPVTDKPLSNFGQAGANVAAGREVARKDLPPVPTNTPATAPADIGNVVPGADAPTGTVTPAQDVGQTKQPSAMSKFANWASSDQSGEDIKKFGRGMVDAGGALSKGVQNVAQGTGKLVKGVGKAAGDLGQGVSDVAQGVGKGVSGVGTGLRSVGSGIQKGLQGVGNVVKGVADVGSQALGGATQMVGALGGGLKHGYQHASVGGKFGQQAGSSIANFGRGSGGSSGGGSTGGAGGAAGGDELADLKSRIQAIDARLKNSGI